ncbi:fructose-specific PTS transporter subunit EIIC [Mycoplasma sp. E35C]|uniref:PTS fructose transporter subunit IIABC n=1 Tax=Mycoplasma sp. E35C TaxID=2801918 RepID=UPI001CA3F6D5|nr:fructose-specific PTS transporter subunit EIIC [Mycoplasma sp. E35C]QZX49375.1 PTS transporter subunit EIIC [Mycoplasma sp. E35C]
MDIKSFLKPDLFLNNLSFNNKQEALKYFGEYLVKHNYASDANLVYEKAIERENQFSTGIGNKIALPHIRNGVMKQPVILVAKVNSMDWQSLDNRNVEVIFFIALDENSSGNVHLEIIGNLSRKLINKEFSDALLNVDSYEKLVNLLTNDDEKKADNQIENNDIKSNSLSNDSGYDLVAITACPTGIAHTFMAAEILEKTAKEMNLKIKVETQGTEGPKNVLSQEEINNAKGVIIAVDKVVDLSRFSGKNNVIETGTKTVIKDAKSTIQTILDNKGKTLEGTKPNASSSQQTLSSDAADMMSFKGFHKRIYKAIMNGVSYMLPFVVFGGIMIALAFLIDINHAGDKSYGSVTDGAKWFKTLGDIAFGLIVPILCAYMAYGLVGKFGLLPGFICGLISSGKFIFDINIETGVVNWFAPSSVSSGFFGAIGGALLTAVILIVLVKYIFNKMPKSLNGIKNILFIPLIGTLLIVVIFWILNIPLIYLNWGFSKLLNLINERNYLLPLLGLVIGLMMSFDLGGPINKAAYLFSIATLNDANSGTVAMAASMASGMVPPLGIALTATFFKNIYDKDERQAAFTNYIMGLSFVSEGAIPFTAKNPKIMVPANLIGGMLTGLLVGIFQITLAAPHGGVFVFALVKTNLLQTDNTSLIIGAGVGLYILSIIIGAFASMILIWLLSKYFNKPTGGDDKTKKQSIKPFWKMFKHNKTNKSVNKILWSTQ